MPLDVYVYATKHNRFTGSDEPTLVHHVGQVSDLYGMKTGGVEFGQVVEGLAGQDPHDVISRLSEIEASLDPEQKRAASGFLLALETACEWCQWVRVLPRRAQINRLEDSDGGTTVADLYQNDFRIVIKKDGVPIS